MAILDTRQLKRQGAEAAAPFRAETRRLVLLYCGVIAAITLGSNGLNLYLYTQIGTTGGLGGLGLRSLLQTFQQVLSLVSVFFGPFWSAGFLVAMIHMVRGTAPQLGDLAEGFRRFGRMLSFLAYEFMTAMMLAMGPVMALGSLVAADGTIQMKLVPMAAIQMVLFFLVYAWVIYGFRMALYLLMDRQLGGILAHVESLRLMRGHKWQLFKLDLRFWWYHGLGLVVSAVGNLDMILDLMGIPVSVDPLVMFFATLIAYCVLMTLLYLWKKPEVDAAYVLAFEAIANPEPVGEME